MRHLQQIHVEFKDKGLVVLGVNVADEKQIALEMLDDNKVTFPNVLDSSEAGMKVMYRDYRSRGVPMSYIIDRDGNIVDAWYGGKSQHERAKAILRTLGIE